MRWQGMPDLAVERTFDVLARTAIVRNARIGTRAGSYGRRLGGRPCAGRGCADAPVEMLKELRGGRKVRRRIGGIAFLRVLKAHRRVPAGWAGEVLVRQVVRRVLELVVGR